MSNFNQKVTNILSRLNSRLRDDLEKTLTEDEFSADLTRETIKYAKMRMINNINNIILNEIEKFKKYKLIIDYSNLPDDVDILLQSIKKVEEEMEIENVDINNRKKIARIITIFPKGTTINMLKKFKRLLLMNLREQKIVPAS